MRTTKYKMTELGPIPVEWEVKRLGEIGTPLMCKRVLKSQTADSGEIPFYKIGTFGQKADAFISRDLYETFKRLYSCPKKGEVLLSAAGTIGRCVIFDGTPSYFQDSNIVWLENDERIVCNEFLYWLYQVTQWQTENGGSVSRLYNDILCETKVVVPPLPEQRRIAEALSDAAAWIESLDNLIEKKKLVKQGAMQALLSGKTRLPGFSGKWEERRLGECGVFRKGSGISREEGRSGNIPAVRYGELYTHHDCIIRIFASHISEAVARRATLLKPGDILFACSGETKEEIGKCAAFIHPVRAYAGGDLLIMTPNPSRCDSTFLGYALNASKCQIQKAAAGQGDAVVHIHKDALEAIEITLPPSLAEQRAIASVLSDMDAELAALSREKAKAEQIKQGMMQELLTGKTRLKGE